MKTKPVIAFIGLGVMGAPMAGHLAKAGHRILVWNRTASRAQNWLRQYGGAGDATLTQTPADAAKEAEIVISCVGDDADLAEVMTGPDGAMTALAQGGLIIDHTTVSPGITRTLARQAQDGGLAWLDAPVSGGQAGAEQGTLSIMCGGEPASYARAQPIMAAYGARMVHVGPNGAGQSAKMVNQICVAGTLAGLAEAIRFAKAADLDMDAVFEAVSGGAAQSWQMDHRWHSMAAGEFDFGFAIDWMRKDLSHALNEARQLGLSAPVTALIDQLYAQVQAIGGGRQDTSALIRQLTLPTPQQAERG